MQDSSKGRLVIGLSEASDESADSAGNFAGLCQQIGKSLKI